MAGLHRWFSFRNSEQFLSPSGFQYRACLTTCDFNSVLSPWYRLSLQPVLKLKHKNCLCKRAFRISLLSWTVSFFFGHGKFALAGSTNSVMLLNRLKTILFGLYFIKTKKLLPLLVTTCQIKHWTMKTYYIISLKSFVHAAVLDLHSDAVAHLQVYIW